jgi:hypothetical protein
MPTSPQSILMPTPTTPEGHLLTRQADETPSNARRDALVPILTHTINAQRCHPGTPATGRDRALRCTASCHLSHARLCQHAEPGATVVTCAYPSFGARESTLASDGPADQPGCPKTRPHMPN